MSTTPQFSFSRRDFMGLIGASLLPLPIQKAFATTSRDFRIRTITAGVTLGSPRNLKKIEKAGLFLKETAAHFSQLDYEVQTLRISTEPFAQYMPGWKNQSSLRFIRQLDQLAVDLDIIFSIGPIITGDEFEPDRVKWAVDLIQSTSRINFTANIASTAKGLHHQTIRSSAEIIQGLAKTTPSGVGNFNFAATAFTPPGTPFFPAAFHAGPDAFSIGLETPRLLQNAFLSVPKGQDAKSHLKRRMDDELGTIEKIALGVEKNTRRFYLGIDTSPAPGPDSSIGKAIEILSGVPFGSPGTLRACAAITDVIRNLNVKTCGYCGLMLPIVEDEVLAQRAVESRFNISELLLYSSVCGTGLDVTPLPGDVSVQALIRLIGDVAALSYKYKKPLSARLFPIPGKIAGDDIEFDHPLLMNSVVMKLE